MKGYGSNFGYVLGDVCVQNEVNCTFLISVRALELPHSGLQVHLSAIALENCSGCRSIHLLFLEHRITAFSRQ